MTLTGIGLPTITFFHFTHLLPLGKFFMGRIKHLPSDYLIALLTTTLFWLLTSIINLYLFQVMCICLVQTHYAHAAWALHTLHMHVKFTLHSPCTHTPNMPYKYNKPVLYRLHVYCILATRMPYIGGTISTCTHLWMHGHIVLQARMPQAQCTYSVCTRNVCIVHTRNTQGAHMSHSPASQMPHMYVTYTSMLQAYQRHTISACMHTIPTYAGYLLLHVYFMQNTCKHLHECTN
jgi:hypothetical protein